MKPLLEKVKSSNLEAIGLDGDVLYVQFIGGGLYSYKPFKKSTFKKFQKAKSKGKFFHKFVKDNKDYTAVRVN